MVSHIREHNKLSLNKPLNANLAYYSELNEWYTSNAFRSFSVKYVIEECIYYKIGSTEIPVQAGHYMVACKNSNVKAYFENRQTVKSICIDIGPHTMAETFTVITDKHHDMDNYLDGYFKYPQFYESVHNTKATMLGNRLAELDRKIQNSETVVLNNEWFMDLAERIIYQEYGNYLCLNELPSVRPATRKEIYRRLNVAKEFMDSEFLNIKETKQIANHCSLSEYHFYRTFKQVFKRTPHQYLTEQKMQLAKSLLKNNCTTITEIAALCGYPDIYSFSKLFKKFFGITPSGYRMSSV